MKTRIIAVLTISCFLSACVTTREAGSMTPAEQQLSEQTKNFNKTVVQGTFWGALAGAAIGAIVSKDRGKGALVGAAIGAGAGALTGVYVGRKKVEYANQEDMLQAAIADAQNRTANLTAIVATAETVLEENRDEVEVLQAQLDQTEDRDAVVRRSVSNLKADLAMIDKAIDGAKGNRELMVKNIETLEKQEAAPEQVKEMRGILASYDDQAVRLSETRDRLATLLESVAS